MAEMNRFSRWLVNVSNARRSARILSTVRSRLTMPPSSRILELGAGRGALSALLQETYHPARLVISDFDPDQLEAARGYLSQRFGTLPSSIEVQRVDAKQIPYDPASFDAVFAIGMLHHVEAHHFDYHERPTALKEIRRVLAPGGMLVYWEFSRTEEMRKTLVELGFVSVFSKPGWRGRELAVVRAPT
ncbi:MAG: class I SAM-dependent methyltransferase [Thermoplasmata archaeon]